MFFIEQSTRYVDFDQSRVQKDPHIMASPFAALYDATLETLLQANKQTTADLIEFFSKELPFEQWLRRQSDKVQQSEKRQQEVKYRRELRAQAFDVSRYLLPQAIQTNIAWIGDARSLEFDIAAWKAHPLAEMQTAASGIERHAGQIAPSLLKYTDANEYYGEKLRGYGLMQNGRIPRMFHKGVDIIAYEHDGLNMTIAHVLRQQDRGGTFTEWHDRARAMSFDEKIGILK